MSRSPDAVNALRDDFRRQLELFYAGLKLAPPYHSVEKAVTVLADRLRTMEPDERELVATDPARRWDEYRRAYVDSGLHLKHRGIIAGLARSGRTGGLPPEHIHFLKVYENTG
jgi:hypothetical protein